MKLSQLQAGWLTVEREELIECELWLSSCLDFLPANWSLSRSAPWFSENGWRLSRSCCYSLHFHTATNSQTTRADRNKTDDVINSVSTPGNLEMTALFSVSKCFFCIVVSWCGLKTGWWWVVVKEWVCHWWVTNNTWGWVQIGIWFCLCASDQCVLFLLDLTIRTSQKDWWSQTCTFFYLGFALWFLSNILPPQTSSHLTLSTSLTAFQLFHPLPLKEF